jgi:putative peptidoglycan lipid II flippase
MVRRVINLMYSEIRGLHQAAYILALFAFGSQMLALVRDRLLAHSFGAGTELDLYYSAFRVPDLLYVLFVSVLSVYVLLPFVTKARAEKGDVAAREVLSQMFSLFLYFYTALAGLLFLAAPYYIPFLFPGFGEANETLILLVRILLLQPFLLGLSSLCGVVTQLSHRFVIYAISPLIYNIAIILGITVLYPHFGLSGLVWGVVIGALGHLLVQWPLVWGSGLKFGFVKKIDWQLIRSVFAVAIPRALTLSTHQLVLLVFIGVATLQAEGSVSVFQFAFNLQSVPLAIIGMSYSVAAFPVLADLYAKQNHKDFNNHLMTALRHIVFWSFPIVALVIVLRAQIVRVVLGSGAFDWNDTRLTAAVLAIFIIGLVAQSILLLLVRAFYAGGKTKIPLLTAIFGASVSLLTALGGLYLYDNFNSLRLVVESILRLSGVDGSEVLVLAFAFVLGTLAELFVLLALVVRNFDMSLRVLGGQVTEALLASLVGGMSAYLTLIFVVDGINQETFVGILLQGGVAGVVGLMSTILTYYLLGSKELNEIYRSYHAKIFKTDVIAPQQDTL